MIRNLLTRIGAYGFAFFLILIEWVLRTLANVESHEFIAPTLAAAGVGFVVPLAAPKNKLEAFSPNTQSELKKSSIIAIDENEQIVFDLTRYFLFVLVGAWVYVVYLCCRKSAGFWGIPPIWFGVVTYLLSVIIAEVREAF